MSSRSPRSPRMIDPLSETLHLLRLSGTLYCRAELTAPWGISIPKLEGVLNFIIVTSGRCWLEVDETERRLLEAGSLTLISHGCDHRIRSDPKACTLPLADIPVEAVTDRYEIMRHGGGGELTQAMYGVLRVDGDLTTRLVDMLPRVLQIEAWDDDTNSWLQSTLRFISREARSLKPGGETVMTRLADVIVIQAIRAWLDSAPEAGRGWLGALRDPQLGRAVALIHRSPEQDFSVASLAEQVGLSRSAFAAHFTDIVGESPMRYLMKVRLLKARDCLFESDANVAEIAEQIGYQSEAAFCRAFKRHFDTTPLAMRKERRREHKESTMTSAAPAGNHIATMDE